MENLIISEEDKYILEKYKVYCDNSNGYYRVYLGKGRYKYLHRFIVEAKKGQIVDHINRNKFDNSRGNLRIVSAKLNCYNRFVDNKNGRGIYFDKYGKRYRACISYKNKTLKLGSFNNILDAKKAYNIKALELYGKDAYQHEL